MNTVGRLLLVCVALLFLTPAAYAKGPPDKVVISGPGLAGSVELTDSALLQNLNLGGLEDFGQRIDPQPQRGGGYQIDRFVRQNARYWVFDRLVYYPPAPGARGVIFYAGLRAVSSGSSEYDGQWFSATAAGDAAMARVLRHLSPPAGLPATGAAAEHPGTPLLWAALLVISGVTLQLANRPTWRAVRPGDDRSTGKD